MSLKRQSGFYGDSKRSKTVDVRTVTSAQAEVTALKRQTTKLARDVRKLKSDREVHYHDELRLLLDVPYDNNNRTTICDPVVGTGVENRIGDSIHPYFIDIRGMVQGNGGLESVVRIMLIQSKQGFTPTIVAASGLGSILQSAASAQAPFSMWTHENREHFNVLHDETFQVGFAGANNQIPFHIAKKLKRPISYDPAGVQYSAGGLYLMMTSTRATADGGCPGVAFSSRTYFYDA